MVAMQFYKQMHVDFLNSFVLLGGYLRDCNDVF